MNPHAPKPQAHEREPTKISSDNRPPERLPLTLDLEKYLGQLDDWDITESQKAEFITTFWNILVSFGELGFSIHPVQRAKKAAQKPRGKAPKPQEKPPTLDDDMLYSAYQKFTIELDEPDAQHAAGDGEIQL